MSAYCPGPGDEVTWPYDPAADVSIDSDDICNVIAWKAPEDPVGRRFGDLIELMAEESPLDDFETRDAAIVFLAQHINDADFSAAVKAALTEAFTHIAQSTDIRAELSLRRTAEI